MPLDPRAEQMLNVIAELGVKPLEQMTPAEGRARSLPLVGTPQPLAAHFDAQLPTRGGHIPVRWYVPESAVRSETMPPVIVYIHGGGWVIGNLDEYELACSALAHTTECVVVSLEYRLAPEFPYPHGLEDCLDAVQHLLQTRPAVCDAGPQQWSCDWNNLFIAGDSAGGNLAAAVTQGLRDQTEGAIRGQILIYPITDCDLTRPSYHENGTGYLLTKTMMEWFWQHYCPQSERRRDSRLSPLRYESVAELPPTFVVTCQYDPLRDEGNAYAAKLQAAGVPVWHQEVPGMIHGYFRYLNSFPQAGETIDQIAAWVHRHCRAESTKTH